MRPVIALCAHSLQPLKSLVPIFKSVRRRQRSFLLRAGGGGGRDTCTSGGVLGRCFDRTDEKLRVRRHVRTASLRSRRAIHSGERRSKRIVARARKNPQSVFRDCLERQVLVAAPDRSKPELYWELLDVNDQGVITLGAYYSRGGAGGTYQAADVLYYASGGYYVALTLYQLWPLQWKGNLPRSSGAATWSPPQRWRTCMAWNGSDRNR